MAERTVKVRFTSDEKDVKRGAGEVETALDKVTGAIKTMNQVAVAASLAVVGAGAFMIANTAQDLANIERINAQTTQTIKSMNAAWTNTTAVSEFANKIEKLTGIEAEQVQEAQNLLLTFGNIRNEVGLGNDIFDQATRIVTDMSVVFGQDASAAAVQLGKALNDPIKGITALSKIGVSFTEQQKEMIKNFVEQGDVVSAQKVILAELTREVGGAAEAFGDTTAGKVAKFKNELGDLQEMLVVALMPALTDVLDVGRDWTAWLTEHEDFTKGAVLTIGGLATAVLGINAAVTTYKTVVDAAKIATEAWTVATVALDTAMAGGWLAAMGPIALALGAIILGIGLITKGMEGLGVTWGDVWDAMWARFIQGLRGARQIGEDFWNWITVDVPEGISRAWHRIWNPIANTAIGAFNAIARAWNTTAGALGAVYIPFIGKLNIPQMGYASYMRWGGNVRAGMPYVVGDGKGPELFVPSTNGSIVSNPADGGNWGSGDIYVLVQVGDEPVRAIAKRERMEAADDTRRWVRAANASPVGATT